MFYLDERHANALAPGKRPRTTLTPSLALRDGEPYLAFGTPGGDQQDQWSLLAFLGHVHFGLDLQAAIDTPSFHTDHFPSSFYPRASLPRRVEIEGRFAEAARAAAGGADERLAGGGAPLLCGIPIGLKDLYAVEGKPLTASSRALHEIPERDCEAWEALSAAGTVLLGHVHTHEFAIGG